MLEERDARDEPVAKKGAAKPREKSTRERKRGPHATNGESNASGSEGQEGDSARASTLLLHLNAEDDGYRSSDQPALAYRLLRTDAR